MTFIFNLRLQLGKTYVLPPISNCNKLNQNPKLGGSNLSGAIVPGNKCEQNGFFSYSEFVNIQIIEASYLLSSKLFQNSTQSSLLIIWSSFYFTQVYLQYLFHLIAIEYIFNNCATVIYINSVVQSHFSHGLQGLIYHQIGSQYRPLISNVLTTLVAN